MVYKSAFYSRINIYDVIKVYQVYHLYHGTVQVSNQE